MDKVCVDTFYYPARCPAFDAFVRRIFVKSPMQRKYILRHFAGQDELFWRRAENFAVNFMRYIQGMDLGVDDVADAYLKMCNDMLTSQIQFRRTGKYPCASAAEANRRVYSSEKEMTSYMIGLALSQFLWPNHYRMYDFFIRESKRLPHVASYMEIGPGHGLFLAEALHQFPDAAFEAVDISPTARKISEALVAHFTGDNRCRFREGDVNDLGGRMYDYIVMCEVMEHLDDPKHALSKIYGVLKSGGYLFITTCANAPAIDHVYLYKSVEHIQQEIRDAYLTIVTELASAVEDVPRDQWSQQKTEVNYAALLKKD